jgi:hypothetical protein
MKAEIVGKNLVITVPLSEPTPSASGKTLVVASSHGNKETDAKINGKPVIIGLKPPRGEGRNYPRSHTPATNPPRQVEK